MRGLLLILVATLMVAGCDLIGPSCVDRQETGPVTSFSGEVGSGATAAHVVRYDVRGSQNDAVVSWPNQFSTDAPRLTFYATRAGCDSFDPAAIPDNGPCATLARAGWIAEGRVASTLIITNGRGNPDVLGPQAEYTIWVVGDPQKAATYTVTVRYFFGPDC